MLQVQKAEPQISLILECILNYGKKPQMQFPNLDKVKILPTFLFLLLVVLPCISLAEICLSKLRKGFRSHLKQIIH